MSAINFKFENIITSEAELREKLGQPSKVAGNKVIHELDQHCKTLINHSPFLVLSTSNMNGKCDASPRGDAPGFVYIVDEKHIIIPERPGNKRIDSISNILSNPHVGILFFIPGMEETLRINGRACIIQDQNWLTKMTANHKVPELGIVIEVEEIFMHCAKAFKRSHLWEPELWPDITKVPTAPEILAAHVKKEEMTKEVIQEHLKDSYKNRLY
ncbi:pyridoxamine 5'-phosphate oxidase family protein [Bacillus salitolerans]|uniref:Pyridoxamine 5'-phosphate oxidase family protein n=1 Tax=Bacillus salitolerans TaxID=1437434 RepID=A0ABW4LQT5_9BACI